MTLLLEKILFHLINYSSSYLIYVGAAIISLEYLFKGKWIKTSKLNHKKILELQNSLVEKGFEVGKLDGLIGFKTRQSIGKSQKELKKRITCYPK